MPKLVKDGAIVDDGWTLLDKSAEDISVPEGAVIVPLNVWLAQCEVLRERSDVGVWLDSDETAEQIGADATALPLIALNFPSFNDGRAFSTARLLRERYQFKGELRAVGEFVRDQLCYLRRCGFNAFAFSDDSVDLQGALKSLNDFSEYYQAAVDQPLPLFRRRAV